MSNNSPDDFAQDFADFLDPARRAEAVKKLIEQAQIAMALDGNAYLETKDGKTITVFGSPVKVNPDTGHIFHTHTPEVPRKMKKLSVEKVRGYLGWNHYNQAWLTKQFADLREGINEASWRGSTIDILQGLQELFEGTTPMAGSLRKKLDYREDLGVSFEVIRNALKPGVQEEVEVRLNAAGDPAMFVHEKMNSVLDGLVSTRGIRLPAKLGIRFGEYVKELFETLQQVYDWHGIEAVRTALDQAAKPLGWSQGTALAIYTAAKQYFEDQAVPATGVISGLVRLDDEAETLLEAQKDAKGQAFVEDKPYVPVSPMLVDSSAVAHYICGPCASNRFPHISTVNATASELCCYCFQVTQVGVVIDTEEDRPRCEHMGDLAKAAINAQANMSPARREFMRMAVDEAAAELAKATGRDITDLVDVTDKKQMMKLENSLNTSTPLAQAVIHSGVVAENKDEFDRLHDAARFRHSNHQHVICMKCWEMGRPMDEEPNLRKSNVTGTCCYCGTRTKCNVVPEDLPDNPDYCYMENDTQPDRYHAVCNKCYPVVTGIHKRQLTPIYQGSYSLGECCICGKGNGRRKASDVDAYEIPVMVYSVETPNPNYQLHELPQRKCVGPHFHQATHAKRQRTSPKSRTH